MRLFLALRLPDAVTADLDDALESVRGAHPELRWIPRERWHLTLAFFGEVPPADLPALRDRVSRRTADRPAMQLRLSGAGRFGDRVLWVGVDGDAEALRITGTRVAVDERPYRPHLTVARPRQRADLRPVVDRLRSYAGPAWHAEELELIESHLGPQPRYDALDSWRLRAGHHSHQEA